jgi:transcription elongation GreA/GreB family factor
MMKYKQELYNQCQAFVNSRLQTIQDIISSNQKALQSETKSSAGDKHETGRAMLQLEIEKAGQQLQSISQMNETLSKINLENTSTIAHLGSLVKTNEANYFLSISAGQLVVENEHYFAVSVSSPIGKLLLGKKEKEEVVFNGKQIKIVGVF